VIVIDIKDEDHGGRGFTCRDPEGHLWSFGSYDHAPRGAERRGQPPGEKPAGDGNVDIRILTSN